MRYTIDFEFDGHGGPLISVALVPEEGPAYYGLTFHKPEDPWVVENVIPYIAPDFMPLSVRWDQDHENWLGLYVHDYIISVMEDKNPTFIADSPVDIGRICNLLSTDSRGNWRSTGFETMNFEVHNVDCWPNDLPAEAIQHNAYWDARALWTKL